MDIKENLPSLSVDKELLQRALMNLIRNASQAMPDGGEVRDYFVYSGKDEIFLAISDTGTGIEEKNLERIFILYYQTKWQWNWTF